jgi:hypothetical protein
MITLSEQVLVLYSYGPSVRCPQTGGLRRKKEREKGTSTEVGEEIVRTFYHEMLTVKYPDNFLPNLCTYSMQVLLALCR